MANLISDRARAIGLAQLKRAAGVVTRRLPIREPLLLVGPGASLRLSQAVADFGHRKILLVTDAVITQLGLLQPMQDALAAAGTAFAVFDKVTQDAPLPVIEQGIATFEAEGCDALIAFGGGSVMDAAKAMALAAANHRHPSELVGYFRGLRGPAPLYAVPTTAGTGSEVTVAAVISDPVRHRKLVIADSRLVPRMAALDPCLMTGLPPHITAATGMDALTHAVEAYIGDWGTPYTERMALAAVAMIYRSLPRACADGSDLVAREQMALAATYAGLAFTRANVGNVHALAHQLGGRYGTPHGLANAVMLAPVLRWCGAAVPAKLAVLALRAGLGRRDEDEGELAQRFVTSVDAMNQAIGIAPQLDALRAEDIPELARAACHEADTSYPVPQVMQRADCEALLREVLPAAPKGRRAPRREASAASKRVPGEAGSRRVARGKN